MHHAKKTRSLAATSVELWSYNGVSCRWFTEKRSKPRLTTKDSHPLVPVEKVTLLNHKSAVSVQQVRGTHIQPDSMFVVPELRHWLPTSPLDEQEVVHRGTTSRIQTTPMRLWTVPSSTRRIHLFQGWVRPWMEDKRRTSRGTRRAVCAMRHPRSKDNDHRMSTGRCTCCLQEIKAATIHSGNVTVPWRTSTIRSSTQFNFNASFPTKTVSP